MTPTNTALKLTGAGWTQVSEGSPNWTHPDHRGPNMHLVALLLSDLPRHKEEIDAPLEDAEDQPKSKSRPKKQKRKLYDS